MEASKKLKFAKKNVSYVLNSLKTLFHPYSLSTNLKNLLLLPLVSS